MCFVITHKKIIFYCYGFVAVLAVLSNGEKRFSSLNVISGLICFLEEKRLASVKPKSLVRPSWGFFFISFLEERELSIMRHAKAGEMRPIVKVSFLIHSVALFWRQVVESWKGAKKQWDPSCSVCEVFFILLCRSFLVFLHNLPTTAIKSWKFLSPGCKNILFVSSPNCLYMWEGPEGSSDSDGCESYFSEIKNEFSRWRHFALNFFHYAEHSFFLFKRKNSLSAASDVPGCDFQYSIEFTKRCWI